MNDQQLQQLLTSASLPAPQIAWTNINALLDEETHDTSLQTKIQSAELEAPSFAWNEIETELNAFANEKIFVQTLDASEITPPPFVWDKIETTLTKEDDAAVASKLITAQLEAPAKSWKLIEEQLQPTAKVIPITKRLVPFYQLAAAAVIVSLLAWGAFQLIGNMNEQELIAVDEPKQQPLTPRVDSNTQQTVKAEVTDETTVPAVAKNQPTSNNNSTALAHEKPVVKKTKFAETNYLLVLNDKGELVRVSKKLSTMDCAKTGEIPVDAVTALQAKDCEDKIKRLQERIATSIMGAVLDPMTISTSAEK